MEMQPVPERFSKPPEVRGGERRLRARHNPSALTYVILGDSNGGIIANISETGMSVTAGEPLREKYLSRLSFRVPQADGEIETHAEVVWTSESKKEAGVRFVELREESRELIRRWVALARRNGSGIELPEETARPDEKHAIAAAASEPSGDKEAEELNGGAHGVEPRDALAESAPEPFLAHESTHIPTAVARSISVSEKDAAPLLAFTGYGPDAWTMTEAQRAEFERLFPSELSRGARNEAARPPVAAPAEQVGERFTVDAPGFAPRIADVTQEPLATATFESERASEPLAEASASVEHEAAETESAAYAPTASHAAAKPEATSAAAPLRMPKQSLWDVPQRTLEPIIGANFERDFGTGFGAPAAKPVNENRLGRMWIFAALTILVVGACFVLGFAEGPDFTQAWPKMQDARRIIAEKFRHFGAAEKSSSTAANPDATIVPAVSSEAAASGQSPAASGPSAEPSAQAVPVAAAPLPTTRSATLPAAVSSASDGKTSSVSGAATDSGSSRAAAHAAPAAGAESAPARTESRPTPSATERNPEAAAPGNSTAAVDSATSVAPNSLPAAGAAVALEAHPSEPAPHSAVAAAAPQSYFPVVAPAAGNVPRLIQLPDERVIDTAAVVIHSHQYVFVPAEPGPETSHALEKLQIGDRITKLAPMYPAEAAQKGMGGTVHLLAVIGTDGKVQGVRPINGPVLLIPAAEDAIRQWRYRPTLLDGQPIEMQEDFKIEFRPLGLH